MIKVGDHIEIKKPKLEAEETFNDVLSALRSNKLKIGDKLTWCETAINLLEMWYLRDERGACLAAKNRLIPILHNLVEKSNINLMGDFFEYYRRTYAFAARRDFESFIDYMEWDQPRKVYANRRTVLKMYVNALQELTFNPNLKYVVASYPPSLGKSFIATLWSAWAFGLSIDNSIIRLSYSEELVLGFSRTVKGYLCSNAFSDVFTRYSLFNGKPFDVERESDWKIKNANVPKSNLISRTRMGSTTGERANFAIIFDDMTKGAEEANSDSTHRLIYDKWNTEWWNRRDGERCKFLFIGTQWTPEDILNRIIDDRNKVDELRETENPYVMRNKDTVVIRVPLLDNEGKTTCEEVYPQEVAEQIKETTDPFLFSCVYQQSPIAPTGREMAWENLTTYIDPPEDLEPYCMAVMDTKRKGKDNLNMFICKPDGNGKHYLWDAIFTKKPMDEMYDDIIFKIINDNITTLVIENNIDVSLKPLLEGKLKDLGKENLCKIIELYNTKKKEERIKNNLGGIQRNIIFKDKSIVKPNTDIGRLMDNITKYSFDYPNKFDDGPDGAAMYNSEIIVGRSILSKPQAIQRMF